MAMPSLFSLLAATAALAGLVRSSPTPTSSSSSSSLPTVDLGSSIHQAIVFNETGNFYNFSNIRYAAAPLGNLRFSAPVAVPGRNTTVDDGSVGRVCPPGTPTWFLSAPAVLEAYLTGQQYTPVPLPSGAPPPDPRISEDCLFLDVIVPKSVLEAGKKGIAKAPVMVWIHGGGYVFSEKAGFDPAGLFLNSPEPFIFVAINYRLGAFGFLGGPSVRGSGAQQPGLLDQRFALEWVQKYIARFGGCAELVTVIGESAGGGSVMHQIAAYGGQKGPVPFKRAILQSPDPAATVHYAQVENITQAYFKQCGVTSLEELQQLPSATLMAANQALVGPAAYGEFVFGPFVDGDFVLAEPGATFASGAYDHDLEVAIGHNSDEGLLFVGPSVNTSTGFDATVQEKFPYMRQSVRAYLENDLYPASAYSGIEKYIDRAKALVGDIVIRCNAHFVARAFGSAAYTYEFAVPPGLHAFDLPYTFNSGANTTGVVFPIATAMQQYLSSFTVNGVPTIQGKNVPSYAASNAAMTVFGPTNVSSAHDDTDSAQCRFWQKAEVDHLF